MKLTSIQDFMNEHYKVEKVNEAKDKDNKELIKALEDSKKHLHKDVDNYKETLKHINDLIKSIKEDSINESKDLSQYAEVIADMTDKNNHMEARLLMATLTENKRLIEVTKATNNIIDYAGSNVISQFTNKLYDDINYAGRKKYGKSDWDKYVYSNT